MSIKVVSLSMFLMVCSLCAAAPADPSQSKALAACAKTWKIDLEKADFNNPTHDLMCFMKCGSVAMGGMTEEGVWKRNVTDKGLNDSQIKEVDKCVNRNTNEDKCREAFYVIQCNGRIFRI